MDWSENTGMQGGIAWTNPDILWASPTIKTNNPVTVAFDRIILLWKQYSIGFTQQTHSPSFCISLLFFRVCSRQPVRKTTQERKHRSSRYNQFPSFSFSADLTLLTTKLSSKTIYRELQIIFGSFIWRELVTCGWDARRVTVTVPVTDMLGWPGGYPPFLTVYCIMVCLSC